MESEELQRHGMGKLRVDLCYACCVIWFDQSESTMLAPAAVIELFQQIHAHQDTARGQLSPNLSCPRCAEHLVLTHDICKSGPLSYYRCPQDNGRLTPFFQFLREKQFLHVLTPAELARVRVQVKQLQCSNCGAPIDLERSTTCSYCGSPISILDTDAVKEAVQMWAAADARERGPTPQPQPSLLSPSGAPSSGPSVDPFDLAGDIASGSDLVHLCFGALGDLFRSL
jgi:hypothetical protein